MLGKNPNEFPKIPQPHIWPEPDKIRFKELYKYQSIDLLKLRDTYKNVRGSAYYIGGILLGCLLIKGSVDALANYHIYGQNGNGGDFLHMFTQNNTYDYYYNREFQRMRYLTEDPQGDDPFTKTRDEVLVDLGLSVPAPKGNNWHAHKKSPHYKYF